MRPHLAIALFTVVTAAGCHRGSQCTPGARSTIELHDGSGATTLSLKGNDLCDAQLRRVATLETKGATVTLRDAAGKLRLELTHESDSVGQGRDAQGPHLRLYRDAHELRVLRGDGVPLGSVVPEGLRAAVVYNPASAPLGKVAMRDRDAVVTDMAGSALTYVVPTAEPGPAGVFGIPHLDPAEALAIYIYWSH
jgi:hypothetical protein